MHTGTVKWFNDRKGWGFILPEDGGEDVFVHFSSITQQEGWRCLREGQRVAFNTVQGEKGLHARDVQLVS